MSWGGAAPPGVLRAHGAVALPRDPVASRRILLPTLGALCIVCQPQQRVRAGPLVLIKEDAVNTVHGVTPPSPVLTITRAVGSAGLAPSQLEPFLLQWPRRPGVCGGLMQACPLCPEVRAPSEEPG